MKIRKYIKRGAALVCFIALLAGVIGILNRELTIKDNNAWTVDGLYREKPDTVDVLIVGSSHGYRSFLPMMMWNDCGYTAYNVSTSSQPLFCSYYLIKDAVKRQHPKVIVLEMYGTFYTDKYGDKKELSTHAALDLTPLTSHKIGVWWTDLRKDFGLEDSFTFLMPLTLYHSRWTEVRKGSLVNTRDYMKGGMASPLLKKVKPPEKTDVTIDVEPVTEEYFRKIADLCKEEDIKLVLPSAPVARGNRSLEIEQKMNGGVKLAKELGLEVFSLDEMAGLIGIDYDTDFYNYSHVNGNGAVKMTKWLEGYLQENTDLTDHRGDPEYSSWAKCAKQYEEHLNEVLQKLQDTADDKEGPDDKADDKEELDEEEPEEE